MRIVHVYWVSFDIGFEVYYIYIYIFDTYISFLVWYCGIEALVISYINSYYYY